MRMTICCESGMRHYLMQGLSFLQHLDKRPGQTLAGLCFLGGVKPPDDRIAVRRVDCVEKSLRAWVLVQRSLKIRVNGGILWGIVGCIPPSIVPGAFDLLQSGRLHSSASDQAQRFLAIDLRPNAAGAPRNKSLQPRGFAFGFFLAIYPPVTESDLHGFGIGDGFHAGCFLRDAHPESIGGGLMLSQPRFPRLPVFECSDYRISGLTFHAWFPGRVRQRVFARCPDRKRRRQSCAPLRAPGLPAPARTECYRGKAVRRRQRNRCRHPCVRAGGIGVTSRSVFVDSAANTRTTTAVMLSFPPFMFAS